MPSLKWGSTSAYPLKGLLRSIDFTAAAASPLKVIYHRLTHETFPI